MASTSTQTAPSTSGFSLISRSKYEVFLSFRGEDTRLGFTDHLYAALKRKGIIVFRDSEKLKEGQEIKRSLKDAIKESQYAVVVISEKFAESKSCLFELIVIMECRRMGRLTVLPVFYYVDPSNVRSQKGSFEDAFSKLEDDLKVNSAEREKWNAILKDVSDCFVDPSMLHKDPLELCRGAFKEVGYISGWHLQYRYESNIVEEISSKIFHQLIRICGMGGIGKTTLANLIYHKASPNFEARCFIRDIGESEGNSLVNLQKQLISNLLSVEVANSLATAHDVITVLKSRLQAKKVLIVLDNVCQSKQVQALAGGPEWFGEGSRIILTSRNHHLPPYLDEDNVYEVKELSYDAAVTLFCSKAFNKQNHTKKYDSLIKDIVDFAKGLPLALVVFGSFLYGEEKSIWESYLDELRANLDIDVVKNLKITFDGLRDLAQEAFLDIVCFFRGESKICVTSELKYLGYQSESILKDLERRYLIKFDENGKLLIHDLLIQMGQQIAKQSNYRLWRIADILPRLRKKNEIADLKGLFLNPSSLDEENMCTGLCFEAFSAMKKLRMLHISNVPFICGGLSLDSMLKWEGESSKLKLSDELRIMKWYRYPLKSLPAGSSFSPTHLFKLCLKCSCLNRLWDGRKSFLELKHIDLSCSRDLIEMPDLTFQVPNLEILDLSNCTRLSMVHSSIGSLKLLKELLLNDCWSLEQLPDRLISEYLEVLNLSHCSKLKNFPFIIGKMSFLRHLDISKVTMKEFPSSFVTLPPVKEFFAEGAHIGELPFEVVFGNGENLLTVMFHGSTTGFGLPPSFLPLSSLKSLILNGWILSNKAESIDLSGLSEYSHDELKEFLKALFLSLRSLRNVRLNNCNLGVIPKSICCWSVSKLDLSKNRFAELPDSICELSNLIQLILNDCTYLQALPKLPVSLYSLELRNCPMLEAFNSLMTIQISREMMWTTVCSSTIAYIGFNCEPYKILYLHPQSPPYKNGEEYFIQLAVSCGPTLGSEIPKWFTHRGTSTNKKIQIHMNWNSDESMLGPRACALFIVYEVHENDKRKSKKQRSDEVENSNIGASEGSNHILPEFICKLQVNEGSPKQTLVFCIPKVACDGSHGVWVFINFLYSFEEWKWIRRSYLASITASSEDVDLKECGACLLNWPPRAEDVGCLDPKSLDTSSKRALNVTGPIVSEL